jgi:hypothetical protein
MERPRNNLFQPTSNKPGLVFAKAVALAAESPRCAAINWREYESKNYILAKKISATASF